MLRYGHISVKVIPMVCQKYLAVVQLSAYIHVSVLYKLFCIVLLLSTTMAKHALLCFKRYVIGEEWSVSVYLYVCVCVCVIGYITYD